MILALVFLNGMLLTLAGVLTYLFWKSSEESKKKHDAVSGELHKLLSDIASEHNNLTTGAVDLDKKVQELSLRLDMLLTGQPNLKGFK
jgi:hypothetical protein